MKTKQERNKALKLYINGTPLYKIRRIMNISTNTLHAWKRQYQWANLKDEAIHKSDKNSIDRIIQQQLVITEIAQQELLKRLKEECPNMDNKELIALFKHRLEIVRPKQVTNNLNISKTDNKIIQVNIPKEVKELINLENVNT